jgi:hypothetical protein
LISGISTGVVNTLVLNYDPVNSAGHATDYLGSYDATETTSSTPTSSQGTVIHANNNNPCADLVAAGQFPWACTPAAPQGAGQIPPVTFTGPGGQTGCGGAPGTFTGTQIPGTIDLFGPAGSAITGVTYLTENAPQGGGTCRTTVQVSFTVPQNIGSNQNVVLSWGGHIASQEDWGQGNGASSIPGSPYRMRSPSSTGRSPTRATTVRSPAASTPL